MDFGATHVSITVQVEMLGSTPVAIAELRLRVQSQCSAHGARVRLTSLIYTRLVCILLPNGDLISLDHHGIGAIANIKNRVNGCLEAPLEGHPLDRHQVLFIGHLTSIGPCSPLHVARTGVAVPVPFAG